MSKYIKDKIAITFASEKLERLEKAKSLFEEDVQKTVEMDDFINMLVKAYMTYRDSRGPSESRLLKKLTEE